MSTAHVGTVFVQLNSWGYDDRLRNSIQGLSVRMLVQDEVCHAQKPTSRVEARGV